jgi:hypothetical protein
LMGLFSYYLDYIENEQFIASSIRSTFSSPIL